MAKDLDFTKFKGRVWVSWECQSCGYSIEINARPGKEIEEKCEECKLTYRIRIDVDVEDRKPPANQLVT